MFGFITAKDALACGFTHHGRFWGLPLWVRPNGTEIVVASKWYPLDYLLFLVCYLDVFLHSIMRPDEDHTFDFLIIDEIQQKVSL